jgi:hypothetical protein
VERGVRYVQLFDAPANNAWDHHGGRDYRLTDVYGNVMKGILA